MRFEIDMYKLTPKEEKSPSKKELMLIHEDDLKHLCSGLKRILFESIDEEYHSKITLKIKKLKNGKHKISYDSIFPKMLKKEVRIIIESSYPIAC